MLGLDVLFVLLEAVRGGLFRCAGGCRVGDVSVKIKVKIPEIDLFQLLLELGEIPARKLSRFVGQQAVFLFLLLCQARVPYDVGGLNVELHQGEAAGVSAEDDVVFVHLDRVEGTALLDALHAGVDGLRGDDTRVVFVRFQVGDGHLEQLFANHRCFPPISGK